MARVYTAGSQVQSADLTALCADVAEGRPLNVENVLGGGFTAEVILNGSSQIVGVGIKSGTGTSQAVIPLHVPSGRQLKRVTMEVFGNGTHDVTAQVTRLVDDATSASSAPDEIGVETLVAPAASWQRMTIDCDDAELDGTSEFWLLLSVADSGSGTETHVRHLRIVYGVTP